MAIENSRGRVLEEIQELRDGAFKIENGRAKPDRSAEAFMSGPNWDDLEQGQRKDVLEKFVDWNGIGGKEVVQVIEHASKRCADREVNPEKWFQGPVGKPRGREMEME